MHFVQPPSRFGRVGVSIFNRKGQQSPAIWCFPRARWGLEHRPAQPGLATMEGPGAVSVGVSLDNGARRP